MLNIPKALRWIFVNSGHTVTSNVGMAKGLFPKLYGIVPFTHERSVPQNPVLTVSIGWWNLNEVLKEEADMIYATGDTHRNISRFSPDRLPEMRTMTKADAVIICGDCGVLWHGDRRDEIQLELLEDLPFTIAFVDGNHENFTALSKYHIEKWNGGRVQFLRPHVIHLMRGQVFTLEGHTFFTMDNAS